MNFFSHRSITGILEKLQITVGRTLPVRLPSWSVMLPSLTPQTGMLNSASVLTSVAMLMQNLKIDGPRVSSQS